MEESGGEGFPNTHLLSLSGESLRRNGVGTTFVVLAGLIASLELLGGALCDHTFLFLGAGEAGTGIAELIALEISKKTNLPVEETRKNILFVDSKMWELGSSLHIIHLNEFLYMVLLLVVRKETLQAFKKPWAHEHESVNNLLDAVKAVKPTVLIGTSGVGRQFTKEVVEAILPLELFN